MLLPQSMYLPWSVPSARVSMSTTDVPALAPSSSSSSNGHSRYLRSRMVLDQLDELSEEERDDVIDFASQPNTDLHHHTLKLWAAATRRDITIWSYQPRAALTKLRRSTASLRARGPFSKLDFVSPTRLLAQTTNGHMFLYDIVYLSYSGVHGFPESVRDDLWPKGPFEAHKLPNLVLREVGVLRNAFSSGSLSSYQARQPPFCVFGNTLAIVSGVSPHDIYLVSLQGWPTSDRTSERVSEKRISSSGSGAFLNVDSTTNGHSSSLGEAKRNLTPSNGSALGNGTNSANSSFNGLMPPGFLQSRNPSASFNASNTSMDSVMVHPVSEKSFDVAETSSSPRDIRIDTNISRSASFLSAGPSPAASSFRRISSARSVLDDESPTSALEGLNIDHHVIQGNPNPRDQIIDIQHLAGQCVFSKSSAKLENPSNITRLFFVVTFASGLAYTVCEDGTWTPFHTPEARGLEDFKPAHLSSVNRSLGLVAVGLSNGAVDLYEYLNPWPAPGHPPIMLTPLYSHTLVKSASTAYADFTVATTFSSGTHAKSPGHVTCLSWTCDGLELAVGFEHGFAAWSAYGHLDTWSVDQVDSMGFEDHFIGGVHALFWQPGFSDLFVLCRPSQDVSFRHDEQLFVIPFVRFPAVAMPSSANHAFLIGMDRILLYRGKDQPEASVISPESDVWQHLKIPTAYIAAQGSPVNVALSPDGSQAAVASARGLTHFNQNTGRWKLFANEREENAFSVVGGFAFYHNIIIYGCIFDRPDKTTDPWQKQSHFTYQSGHSFSPTPQYQVRFITRDQNLTNSLAEATITLVTKPLLITVIDDHLLVYTEDNTLHHFVLSFGVNPTARHSFHVTFGSSIGFEGIIQDASLVKGLSWILADRTDPGRALSTASIVFLTQGRLVLLTPVTMRDTNDVSYKATLLSDRVEFFWSHLTGLEKSVWAWIGSHLKIWLDPSDQQDDEALANGPRDQNSAHSTSLQLDLSRLDIDDSVVPIDDTSSFNESGAGAPSFLNESFRALHNSTPHRRFRQSEPLLMALDFVPLSILMDRGIIAGVSQETYVRRALPFVLFRTITSSHLFVPGITEVFLGQHCVDEAVDFVAPYAELVYFSHILEIVLYSALENENPILLEKAVEFLDHFPQGLEVVAACARKTDMSVWPKLFAAAGTPRVLFERSINLGLLNVGASYLLVLHNLDSIEQSSRDTVLLLKAAIRANNWFLWRELLRFLLSLDPSGDILRMALDEGQSSSDFHPRHKRSQLSLAGVAGH